MIKYIVKLNIIIINIYDGHSGTLNNEIARELQYTSMTFFQLFNNILF